MGEAYVAVLERGREVYFSYFSAISQRSFIVKAQNRLEKWLTIT